MNTIYTTEIFDNWFAGLRDNAVKRRIQIRIDRAEDGNFSDCKPVGQGVSENWRRIPHLFQTGWHRSFYPAGWRR